MGLDQELEKHVIYHDEALSVVWALKLLLSLKTAHKLSEADANLTAHIIDSVGGIRPLEKRWKCESLKLVPFTDRHDL